MRLLLIEDEKNLRDSVQQFLIKEGYRVTTAETFAQARSFQLESIDLIILDWNLPDGTGLDLLKEWRQKGFKQKILFLTARTDIFDRVLGLELGAQDYLVKPFDPRELIARIRVQLRDLKKSSPLEFIEYSQLQIQLNERRVFFQNKEISLTKMEYELLLFLASNPNKPYSREELLNHVWGLENFPTTRTIDNHILQLRQKISVAFFETIHGIGYRFKI